MKVTLAFVSDGESIWLQSAYDEYTADSNSGVPGFHQDAMADVPPDYTVRECIIDIRDASLESLFMPSEVDWGPASSAPGSEPRP